MSNIIKNLAVNLNHKEAVYIDVNINDMKEEVLENDKTIENDIKEENIKEKDIKEEIILEARKEAEKIILEAKEKAALMLEKAKQEAENIKINTEKESRKRGYEEGFKKGSKESDKLYKQAKLELDNATKERQKIIDDIEPKMVDLILDICEKILGQSIKTNKKSILYLIRKGFSEIKDKGQKITIKVSENDYETILEFKEDFLDGFGFKGEVDIVKDSSLKLGDCIIESDFGNIDCSLGTQFEGLKQELLFLLGA